MSDKIKRRLALELTENLLVEHIEDSIKLIASLKENAIDCDIDDFGTGTLRSLT